MDLVRLTLFLVFIFTAQSALADQVRAVCRELTETATLELEKGEKAKLTVYLKSSGDPVDGFTVQVFTFPMRKNPVPLAEVKSNRHGIAEFRDLLPATYHFQLKPGEKPLFSTQIGDMRLTK